MLDQHVLAVKKQQVKFLDRAVGDIGLAVIDQLVPRAENVRLPQSRFRQAQRRVAYRLQHRDARYAKTASLAVNFDLDLLQRFRMGAEHFGQSAEMVDQG